MNEMLRNQGLKRVRMRVITAVIVVFTLTCSGSFGMEDVMSSSGPGVTLLMILILPFVWSVPLAFVSSELGSMIPEAGGLYRWVRRAMGEYWGFQAGWWWTLSLYVDSAVYVALALDYMASRYGWVNGHSLIVILGWHVTWRVVIGATTVALFTFINIRGLDLTGWALTVIQVLVMVPFVIFVIYGLTRGSGNPFHPILVPGQSFFSSMELGLAIMLWMYSGWESMSTLSGEIENPQRVIPKALMMALPLVIGTYFITVFAAYRATGGDWANMWTGGGGKDFVVAANIISGSALMYMMLVSAVASNIGLYAGYLATGARPAFQMSRDRLLPKFYGRTHAAWGTPWVAILIMGIVDGVLIQFRFDVLVTIDVFLLMFAYILIFISCIVMRVREPDTPRQFRVPLPTWALTIWVAAPIAIAIVALFIDGIDWMIGGLIGILTGPIAYVIFKNIYKGTTEDALEGTELTPETIAAPAGAGLEGVPA
jgi:amino acid transporter